MCLSGAQAGFADGFSSVSPDDITLKAGITTVVDAGTSGWRNFPVFKNNVIDRSHYTRPGFSEYCGLRHDRLSFGGRCE